MGFRWRYVSFLTTLILMGAGIACALRYSEPIDPISITPVAYQTQTPVERATPTPHKPISLGQLWRKG